MGGKSENSAKHAYNENILAIHNDSYHILNYEISKISENTIRVFWNPHINAS